MRAVARTVELAVALRATRRHSALPRTWAAASASTTTTPDVPALVRLRARPSRRSSRVGLASSSWSPGASSSATRACCSRACVYNKVSGDKRFVIVDAGMNDLHPAEPLRGHPPHLARRGRRRRPRPGRRPTSPSATSSGPVCETGDFLGQRPRPAAGRPRRPARRHERGRLRLRDGQQLQRATAAARGPRRRRSLRRRPTRARRSRTSCRLDVSRPRDADGPRRGGARREPRTASSP